MHTGRLWIALALLWASCAAAWAQEAGDLVDAGQPVHWAFAPLLGTGWYDIEGGRSAFIAGANPRQVLRAAVRPGAGARQIGVNVRYDATLGLYRLEDILDFSGVDNVSTLSFTPGIELEIPMNERWDLKTFTNLGWGTALSEDVSSWIYYAGVKSRYMPGMGRGSLAILNGAWYAGYSPDHGKSGDLTAMFAGLEYRHGVSRPRWRGEQLDLVWHLGYTFMADPAEFGLRDASLKSIRDTVEIGLAIAPRNRPFRIWGLEFDRVGLTYSRGEDGEFGSVMLNLSSWFDR